jgi:zinc/manganese transport system permease protein
MGSILTVTPREIAWLAALYGLVGAVHFAIRRPLLEISLDPDAAIARGRAVRWWDLCFYVTFGVVVTSSVRIAGVLLVFSYLIVPAAAGALLCASVTGRLLVGWGLGFLVSALGLFASFAWDLPTGPAIVTTFGVLMVVVALALGARLLAARFRREGWRALAPVGAGVCALVAAAGLSLALVPQMDHHWLDRLEDALPGIEGAFLSSGERPIHRETRADLARQTAELNRLRAMQQDADWGTRELSPETRERLRQFLASGGEISAGDRLVLATLRRHARERQRFWLGLPLFVLAAAGAWALARTARRR